MAKASAEKELQVVIARATRDPADIEGSGTCLFSGVPIATYGQSGFLFLHHVRGLMTMENQSSHAASWSRGSEEGGTISRYDIEEASQEEISPVVALGQYLIKKPFQSTFNHNEIKFSGEKPWGVFCVVGANLGDVERFRSRCYRPDLPILQYDQKQGKFCILDEMDRVWKPYQFSDNVLSAQNPQHIKLATHAAHEHAHESDLEKAKESTLSSVAQEFPSLAVKATLVERAVAELSGGFCRGGDTEPSSSRSGNRGDDDYGGGDYD